MNLNSFLKEVFTGDNIHDFQHASRVFTTDSFRLSPKYAFLYFVRVNLDASYTQFPDSRRQELGALCKSVTLPKFTVETKTYNAYNRPNIVQSKIKYDNVEFKFHDDNDDVMREFWYDYYSFYYRDADYNDAMYSAAHKYRPRTTDQWGLTNRNGGAYATDDSNNPNMIKSISIFSFHQKRFSEYVLHNPMITRFGHGDHAMSGDTGIMENSMSVAYESVTYRKGFVTKTNFSDMMLHYDQSPSPLTPAGGGTASLLGPGGALETADDVITDLQNGNFGAAIFKAGHLATNFHGKNIGAIAKAELLQVGTDILRGNNPLSKISVPSLGGLLSGDGAATGSSFGSSLIAAGGIAAAGAALLGGSGGNKAILAIGAGAYLLGKKSQENTPATSSRQAVTNGEAVGNPSNPANTTQTVAPLPAIPGIQGGAATSHAALIYASGQPTMNDTRDVVASTDTFA